MHKLYFIICIMISGIFILSSCSDPASTSDDPDDGDGSGNLAELSVSITNPGNGDLLGGVVTVTAEAEAEHGIEEVRFFLGDNLLASVDSSPFEYEVDTREHPNGEYEIRIEAEPAEADTVITETISVELENYMVELETVDFVTGFTNQISNNDMLTDFNLYILISAPDGRVLAEEELTQDGLLNLLPPEALSDGAPEHYQLTIAEHRISNQGRETLNLFTETALESWSTFRIEKSADSKPSSMQEVEIELNNIQEDPYAFMVLSPGIWGYLFYQGQENWSSTGTFQKVLPLVENTSDLILASFPTDPAGAEGNVPRYYWERSLQSASSLNYDVAEQFETMSVHAISYPSNIQGTNVNFNMSVEQDSWESGAISFPGFWFSHESSSEMKMYVPDKNHRFHTEMSGSEGSADGIFYMQAVSGELPSSFDALDAEATLSSSTLDDIQLQTSGTMDVVRLNARTNTQDPAYQNIWSVFLANTATSFVFPRIADSLDQKITHYSRSEFQLTDLIVEDVVAIDGLEEYREYQNPGPLYFEHEYRRKVYQLNSGQQKRKHRNLVDVVKSDRNQQEAPLSPPYRLIKY